MQNERLNSYNQIILIICGTTGTLLGRRISLKLELHVPLLKTVIDLYKVFSEMVCTTFKMHLR